MAVDARADGVCVHPAASANARAGASSFEGILAAGRADLAAGRAEDAAARFRSVAFDRVAVALALEATTLYLEALNVLGSKHNRDECYDEMARDVPLLRETWCNEALGQADGEACMLLDAVHWDIARLRAQKVVEEADKKGGLEVVPLYERAGHLYADIFRDACDTPVRNAKKPRIGNPSGCEEVAYNAARAFTAARLRAKAIAVFRSLLAYAEKTGATSSPLVGRAMHDLAGSYQAIAMFELAAEWHEQYATLFPKERYASESMTDAAILRIGLGQDELALRDRDFFLKTWGHAKRNESASLVYAFAAHHFERDEREKARAMLGGAMESFDRGPLDIRIRAHALYAKVAPARASAEWATVRGLWSDPRTAQQRIRMTWASDDDLRKDRRLAQALTAVGEALVAAADEKRAAGVDGLRYPAFSGTGDRAGIEAFVVGPVREWFDRKRKAITAVEPAYIEVLELHPIPVPKSAVASAATVAKMWSGLADELRNAPVTDRWRHDKTLYRAYLTAAAPMIQSVLTRFAKPSMQKCVDLSVKYQMADSPARDCETWLVKNFPDEWRAVDEILPAFRAGPRSLPASPIPASIDPR